MSRILILLAVLFTMACGTEKTEQGKTDEVRQYFEWRTYLVDSLQQQTALIDFLEEEVVPAYRNAGVETIGVFTNSDSTKSHVYLLLPFHSLDEFGQVSKAVSKEIYKSQAPANVNENPDRAHFVRMNSTLLESFELAPELKLPSMGKQPGRIFEWRSYESYSERKGVEKVAMFNEGGEIEIFERLGFQPVFFGEAMIGDQRPNLVYMTTHESWDSVDSKWDAFVADSVWVAIKEMDRYANTVSKIHKEFLVPLPFSDI